RERPARGAVDHRTVPRQLPENVAEPALGHRLQHHRRPAGSGCAGLRRDRDLSRRRRGAHVGVHDRRRAQRPTAAQPRSRPRPPHQHLNSETSTDPETSPTLMPRSPLRHPARALAPLLALTVLAGCSNTDQPATTPVPTTPVRSSVPGIELTPPLDHLHGLHLTADETILAGTHTSLFALAAD